MAIFAQNQRLLTIGTPLGGDVMLLAGFTGTEKLSRLYTYQLDLLSEREDIAPQDIVGKNVTWVVNHVDREPRCFNGYVSRFSLGSLKIRGMRAYRAEAVPWLWFLTRSTNCRIFQNLSTPEIIQTVFADLGFTDFQLRLQDSYPPREYCVQYRETAFNFVSRLMEQDGIFYFFQHENGNHALVLADAASAFKDVPETPVSYTPGSLVPNHVTQWEHQYAFGSGRWTQTDYNFQTPGTSLLTSTDTMVPLTNLNAYEKFDYPGLYQKSADGSQVTRTRMQEEETAYDVASGSSQCCTFTPGGKFTLQGHLADSENKGYALTSVTHTATDTSYEPGGGASEYGNRFTCIPDAVAFRPARLTPRPTVQGPQTAVVVGPAGEEIYTDPFGRVKVQFFWDRLGPSNETSSCWIRVSQNLAGKNWGLVAHPRIGQEVIVDFLEGDPDRPIITGRVYNAGQMPIYPLPANQTQIGLKSRSSKGGDVNNFNELRFEDQKGTEHVYFHAEKDFNRVVENNDSLIVGSAAAADGSQTIQIWKNRSEFVQTGDEFVEIAKGNRAHKIKQNDNLTVEGNQTIAITQNRNEIVKSGNETVVIAAGNRTHNVKQNDTLIVEGNQTIEVTQNYTRIVKSGDETVVVTEGSRAHSVKKDDTLTIAGKQTQQITGDRNVAITNGSDALVIKSGSYTLQASESIELVVGSSVLRLDASGITLEGTLININGGAVLSTSAPVTQIGAVVLQEMAMLSGYDALLLTLGGLLTTVSGMAIAQLGGGLTLIGPQGPWAEAGLTALQAAEDVTFAVAPIVATEAEGGTVTTAEWEMMALNLGMAAAGPLMMAAKPLYRSLKGAMAKVKAAQFRADYNASKLGLRQELAGKVRLTTGRTEGAIAEVGLKADRAAQVAGKSAFDSAWEKALQGGKNNVQAEMIAKQARQREMEAFMEVKNANDRAGLTAGEADPLKRLDYRAQTAESTFKTVQKAKAALHGLLERHPEFRSEPDNPARLAAEELLKKAEKAHAKAQESHMATWMYQNEYDTIAAEQNYLLKVKLHGKVEGEKRAKLDAEFQAKLQANKQEKLREKWQAEGKPIPPDSAT